MRIQKKNLCVLFSALLFPWYAGALNYFRCEKKTDCAKVYAGCGRYDSVHIRYKELYGAKARKGDTVSFCAKPSIKDIELKENGQPACFKKNCRLMIPEKNKKTQ